MNSNDIAILEKRRKQAVSIIELLEAKYGLPHWHRPCLPLDELISTILSQNTNDRNRDAAYKNLRNAFPDWEMVRDAKPEDVIEAIRIAGLANQKGPRIQQVLKSISKERGNLDLSFLMGLSQEDARAWLLHFKGVGPKTAAIVLCFSLDKPAFPVDTHIYRVSGRLGLRDRNMTAEAAHIYLEKIFPPESYAPLHLNLIRLGREICHPRKPDCMVCSLNSLCEYALFRDDAGKDQDDT